MTAGGCTGALAAPSHHAWDWPVVRAASRTLPGGLRVVLAEHHTVPLVWLGFVSRAGIACDTPELSGRAVLTPLLLREGTARRSAARITGELEDLGAHLSLGCDWDSAFIRMQMLAEDLDAGLDLLLDMAGHAEFPPDAVARVRRRKLLELEQRGRQAAAIADQGFARVLYGDSVYGRSPLGSAASLERIGQAEIGAFHAERYAPATSCLVVVGSFDAEDVARRLGRLPLASRSTVPAGEAGETPVPAAEGAAGVWLADVPRAGRTELRVGHAGAADGDPELPALQLLAAVLGGGPSSRLAADLRQRQGLTYQIQSRFLARRAGGPFVVETSVPHGAASAALEAITGAIERLRERPVPDEELDRSRRRLLGEEIRRFHTVLETGVSLSQAALDGDPGAHFERKRRVLAEVDADALLDLARRRLHPERLTTVAAGPVEELQNQFSRDAARACRPVPAEARS